MSSTLRTNVLESIKYLRDLSRAFCPTNTPHRSLTSPARGHVSLNFKMGQLIENVRCITFMATPSYWVCNALHLFYIFYECVRLIAEHKSYTFYICVSNNSKKCKCILSINVFACENLRTFFRIKRFSYYYVRKCLTFYLTFHFSNFILGILENNFLTDQNIRLAILNNVVDTIISLIYSSS